MSFLKVGETSTSEKEPLMERHKDPKVLREVFRHLEILSVLGYTVLLYNVHAV